MVTSTIESKFDRTFKDYAQNLIQFKIYDTQFGTDYSGQYIIKLKNHCSSLCKNAEILISSLKIITELDEQSEKF